MPFTRDEEEDATFDEVSSMAERLGLKGKDRARYIDDHMIGLGYEPIQSRESYVRRQQQDDEGGDGGYGSRWGFGGRGGSGGGSSGRSGRSSRDEGDSFG